MEAWYTAAILPQGGLPVLGTLVILTLAPAAPVPKAPPPPIEVTAKPYAHPRRLVDVGGMPRQVVVDAGHFIEVVIKNTSPEAVSFDPRHELGDLVYVKVTDEKGGEVSRAGYHLELLC